MMEAGRWEHSARKHCHIIKRGSSNITITKAKKLANKNKNKDNEEIEVLLMISQPLCIPETIIIQYTLRVTV